MRLKLYFLPDQTPIQMDWNKKVLDFPKIVNYKYRNWEWFMYNPLDSAGTEWELKFTELKIYDPRALECHPTLSEVMDDAASYKCDCGAEKNPDTGGHWQFCKLYKKN
jgi:hypothetical protein